jgi:hypothetical protein
MCDGKAYYLLCGILFLDDWADVNGALNILNVAVNRFPAFVLKVELP